MLLQIDVWGGEGSMDHVARYRCELSDPRLARDLEQGFLINVLRVQDIQGDHSWRDDPEFDARVKQ